MYNYKKYPEIYSIRENEITEELGSDSLKTRRSQTSNMPSISSIQSYRPPLVKQYYSSHLKTWIPWSLHPDQVSRSEDTGQSVEDTGHAVGEVRDSSGPEMDIRPHIWDPVLKQFLLCDSGSQVSAFPPDPGDLPVRNQFLKAANGSRMACYGYKEISVKIGRKPYKFRIIKAQVESPIIGWDFMKLHKLDLRWNDQDHITIYDKHVFL